MTSDDYSSVAAIYIRGIETGHATFETMARSSWEEFAAKYIGLSRFVAVINDDVVGWATLSQVSARPVYAGVCEVSVYVNPVHHGKKIGSQLLQHLVDVSEKNGIWTLQAGIFPENTTSVRMHLNRGFRIVGTREKIGRMNGAWRDTLLLERRSSLVN